MWETIREFDFKGWGPFIYGVAYLIYATFTVLTLYFTVRTQKRTAEFQHYGEIDKMYFEILKIATEKPHFRKPDSITDPKERAGYDAYAYIVMNFVETIFDRSSDHAELLETWKPVVLLERKLHEAWFKAAENLPKFKKRFRDWLNGLQPDDESAGS